MIALVEGAIRQRTPNEIALSVVLAVFTLIFLIVTATLWPIAYNVELYMKDFLGVSDRVLSLGTDVPTLVALLVCLIPTTIGALLAAIGIAGMDRALRANIIAKSGKAVEVAGDVDTLLLDKTGTITVGNRRATQFIPFGDFTAGESRPPGGPGLGRRRNAGREEHCGPLPRLRRRRPGSARPQGGPRRRHGPRRRRFIPFTAQTRMSGIDLADGRADPQRGPGRDPPSRPAAERLGAAAVESTVADVAGKGATPLLVSEGSRLAGMVVLEDILKPGIAERFERLRRMGLRTVMVTGDNPLTAKAIAQQAGVDDYIAEATPEAKLAYIRKEQAAGKLVAMMGDGTNDAPALAQADVGVAMNSGTQAAKEAGNMVDLDSDPTKLIEVVEIGKQLLITRGALTTFSIANDVAKYFAIVPAMFAATLPWLKPLDIMGLHSATSAILSAVIFNAIIIPLLIPIALKGVKYRPVGADALLRRNLLIWGLGGVITPFIGIKLIDLSPRCPAHGLALYGIWSQTMTAHLRANLWLLVLTVLLCSVLYPLVLLGIGQTVFHDKAQGSLLTDAQGHPIGSRLIAQPFTARRIFPTPAFGGILQRRRLRRFQLGRQQLPAPRPRGLPTRPDRQVSQRSEEGPARRPRYRKLVPEGPVPGKAGNRGPVGGLDTATVAQNWVKADKLNAAYVADWQKAHPTEVAQWIKANPDTPEPKPEDLAVPFFASFSKDHPGMFPSAVEHKTKDGKTEKQIEPVKEGADIQSHFFDMWLEDHKDAEGKSTVDLEPVPGDAVTTSGSGLDPDITLDNALWQLDRVADAWAKKTGKSPATVRDEIEKLLRRDRATRRRAGCSASPWSTCWKSTWRCETAIKNRAARGADVYLVSPLDPHPISARLHTGCGV